jgi:hypothetical protein
MRHTSLESVHVHSNFSEWKIRFTDRRKRLDLYRVTETRQLHERERTLITPSIRDFQKGEGSDGRHLMKIAREHGVLGSDSDYLACLEAFVREEQTHSETLSKFMKIEGIEKKTSSFLDGAFRLIRRIGGLELSIRVLMSAEILGIVYYKALQNVTQSESLKTICQSFLEDEREHLVFESYAIAQINQTRTPLKNATIHVIHGLFVLATASALWVMHHEIFRSYGRSFHTYLNETVQILTNCLDRMNKEETSNHLSSTLWEPVA